MKAVLAATDSAATSRDASPEASPRSAPTWGRRISHITSETLRATKEAYQLEFSDLEDKEKLKSPLYAGLAGFVIVVVGAALIAAMIGVLLGTGLIFPTGFAFGAITVGFGLLVVVAGLYNFAEVSPKLYRVAKAFFSTPFTTPPLEA